MRPWWFALIAGVAAASGAAGWWLTSTINPAANRPAATAGAPGTTTVQAPRDLQETRRRLPALLAEAKQYASFFRGLQSAFPADYEVDLNGFAIKAMTSGTFDTPDAYFTDAYRALRQTRGVVAAKASLPPLSRMFDAQAAILKAMGDVDPHLCVDSIYGGASNAYFAFAAAHRGLVAEQGEASLAAIVDGKNTRAEKASPSDADFQAVEQALTARGLSKAEVGVLIDGKPANPPIPDARMCNMALIYLAVLKALPADLRWRMYRLAVELAAPT